MLHLLLHALQLLDLRVLSVATQHGDYAAHDCAAYPERGRPTPKLVHAINVQQNQLPLQTFQAPIGQRNPQAHSTGLAIQPHQERRRVGAEVKRRRRNVLEEAQDQLRRVR